METLLKENIKTNQEKQNQLLNKALLKSCANHDIFYDACQKMHLENIGHPEDTSIHIPAIDCLDQDSKELLDMALNYISGIIRNSNLSTSGYGQEFFICCKKDNMIVIDLPTKNRAILIHVLFTEAFVHIKEDQYLKDFESYLKNACSYKEIDLFSYHARFYGDLQREKQILR